MILAPAALGIGTLLGLGLGGVAIALAPPPLRRENFAGRVVPRTLGLALVPAVALALYLVTFIPQLELLPDEGVRPDILREFDLAWLVALAGALAVVGFLDDLFGEGARGFRGHLGQLRRLRVTTGILKLVTGVAAGALVAYVLREDPLHAVAAGVLVVVATNVWNALDVVPGRALKWAVLALAAPIVLSFTYFGGGFPGALAGVALGLLVWDLRERGMLGDAGSNPLGFLVGVSLAAALPTWGVGVAAGAVLFLQVAAETVTISRLIDAVPPLRWFDRLGRRRDREPATS